MASLWQKKRSGTWYISYRLGRRQTTRSLKTNNKSEAIRRKLALELTLAERNALALQQSETAKEEKARLTFEKFWEELHEWALLHRAPATIGEYDTWLRQFKGFVKVQTPDEVTRKHVEDFKAALSKQGVNKPKGVGLNPVSINNGLKCLQSVWSIGIKQGLLTNGNPFKGVERLRIPISLDKAYLDKEQIDALLQTALAFRDDKYIKTLEAQNVYLAIALMSLAGLRKREACFARWDWIDWHGRVIKVDNDSVFTTKNRQPRIISMSSQLIEILQAYRKSDGYILEPVRAANENSQYRVDFDRSFRTVCKKSGISSTPHSLRHSFASRHAVSGTPLHVIAGWLGHSTTSVTQLYAHFQRSFNAAADNI
jgi:integrase